MINGMVMILFGVTALGAAGLAAACRHLARLKREGGKDWGKESPAKWAHSQGILFILWLMMTACSWYFYLIQPIYDINTSATASVGSTILMILGLLIVIALTMAGLLAILWRYSKNVDIESEGSGG